MGGFFQNWGREEALEKSVDTSADQETDADKGKDWADVFALIGAGPCLGSGQNSADN
jgi:hypothetical protein